MITLLIALLVCFALMFLLGREHALDEIKRAEWQRHTDQALALAMEAGSRSRHCAGRDL